MTSCRFEEYIIVSIDYRFSSAYILHKMISEPLQNDPSTHPETMPEYSSVTEFLQTETLDNLQGATIDTDFNGDTVITAQIRLADHPDEESIDISNLDNQEMDRLRDADPFLYHSIVRERRRSSLLMLEGEEEEEEGQNIEFDLREMDRGGGLRSSLRSSLRRSMQGLMRRQSSGLSEDAHSMTDSSNNGGLSRQGSSAGSSDGSHHSAGNSSGGLRSSLRMTRPALGRRRSSLYNVDEEDEVNNEPDPAEGSNPANPANTGAGLLARQYRRDSESIPTNLTPAGGARRRSCCTVTSTGSSVVARKRRFSTEAHSSLIMANIEAALNGSVLTDSPDLDSLFDQESNESHSDSDDDLLSFLRD
jgi:hypothetical protein